MILNYPQRLSRFSPTFFGFAALLLAPATAFAADPTAPSGSPAAMSSATVSQAPLPAPAPAPAATPAAPAQPATASASPPPPPSEPAARAPAPRPPGWEGESAKDRLSASMYPHEAEKIKVDLRGEEGDTFYAWLGDGRSTSNATTQIDGEVFEQLCDSPCSAMLPTGRNRIAVARGGSPVVASQDITLYAPTTLAASYTSYTLQRLFGALILVGGSVAGVALVLTAPECEKDPSNIQAPEKCDNTQEYIGIGVGIGSVVAGSLLLMKSDDLEISIAPGAGGTPAPQGRYGKHDLAHSLKGFQVNVRF